MVEKAASRALAQWLLAQFERAGAQLVEADILQPADLLLDLYGEDIRARAYTTSDPLRGEQMLRPDFTVPVVQMHMDGGAEPARYAYMGEVFRRQDTDAERACEYMQVGYEAFDRDAAAADAEVFGLFSRVLAPYGLAAVTGDIGLVTAAVQSLNTSARRKAALMRHVWRPRRFRQLLERYSGALPVSDARAKLLSSDQPFKNVGPLIGKRSAAQIEARLDVLRQDAATAPIGAGEVELLNALLNLRETCPNALSALCDFAVDFPLLAPAVQQFDARLDALSTAGVGVDDLPFEASFGRTSMEYYDGFVFGFRSTSRLDLPPIATGGRYDALTERLGNGRTIPAVGGVIRPGLLLEVAQ